MSKFSFALVVFCLLALSGRAQAFPRTGAPDPSDLNGEQELEIQSFDADLEFQLDLVEKACAGCNEDELQDAFEREYLYYLRRGLDLVDPTSRTVVASWYGGGEKLAKHTANGEVFNPGAMTAAMRSCPFGTKVKVTNPKNGKWVIVRVNDRGPAKWTGASIDLTRAAARKIGINKGKVTIDKC
jgi:hypothetical protein